MFGFGFLRLTFVSQAVFLFFFLTQAQAQLGIITGAGVGGGPHLYGRWYHTMEQFASHYTYSQQFSGGVRVASCDVNADGIADVITGAGEGGGPHIKVFDGRILRTGTTFESASFYGLENTFTGGAFVACADFNRDAYADVVIGAGRGGAPRVRVVDGRTLVTTGQLVNLLDFYAYGTSFSGGVSVAAGDVNGDGIMDVVTGAGPGGAPHVRAFSGNSLVEIMSFYPYSTSFSGGVDVAVGDIDADGSKDIITAAGAGAAPHVRVISYRRGELASFFSYETVFTGGVHVGAFDYDQDGRDDIMTGAGINGGPRVRIFSGANLASLRDFYAYSTQFPGGSYVAGGNFTPPACSDGVDNDGDGAVDYPADFSCSSVRDPDERSPIPQCGDGIDNDQDGLTDTQDPGCPNNQGNNEGSVQPQCGDGIDNDEDGAVDYPADFSCSSRSDTDEGNPEPQCGDGIDNDRDGLTDTQDPGCPNNQGNNEGSVQPECGDGIDNDEDGAVDYPADFSCSSRSDPDEGNPQPQCGDGIDNDRDGLIDTQDPGCPNNQGNNEGSVQPQCGDGIDNDGDGAIDFPADFSCSSATDRDERLPFAECGDGIDNDRDGRADLQDAGCSNSQDNSESGEALASPTQLQASDNDRNGIRVTWMSVAGANGYDLYRSEVPNDINPSLFVRIASISTNTYYDTAAVPGRLYNYAVRATSTSGQVSGFSNVDGGIRPSDIVGGDSDGDGVSDEQEAIDGTDPRDSGSFALHLKSPAFSKYNTFLSQLNYLELVGDGTRSVNNIRVTAYSILGEVVSTVELSIDPQTQVDLDINALVNQRDTYGVVKIEFRDDLAGATLKGRMTNYRPDPRANTYSFAFTKELRNPTRGDTFAMANSFDPQGMSLLVPNWMEVINLDAVPRSFVYSLYSQSGHLLYQLPFSLAPLAERDIQAGHEFGEGAYLGVVQPLSGETKYFAGVSRYSSDSRGGAEAQTYSYAFNLEARPGNGSTQFAPTANEIGACYSQSSWFEVANVRSVPVTASVSFRAENGALLGSSAVTLAPRAQYHFNASALLGRGERGSVSLASSHSGGLISQSLVYFHDCARNRVQTAYAAQGRIAGQDVQTGSINTFLGMSNSLRLISALSTSNTTATVSVRPFGASSLSPQQFTVGANSAQGVSLTGVNAAFAFPNSSYGTISIQTPQARQLVPSVLRNRLDPDGSGRMDFVIPVTIQ